MVGTQSVPIGACASAVLEEPTDKAKKDKKDKKDKKEKDPNKEKKDKKDKKEGKEPKDLCTCSAVRARILDVFLIHLCLCERRIHDLCSPFRKLGIYAGRKEDELSNRQIHW